MRIFGVILILIGLLYIPMGVGNEERLLRANVIKTLEAKKTGFEEPLRNTTEQTDVTLVDPQEYSINGIVLIESEGFEAVLMDDISEESLNFGIGHYPGTVFPGQLGNFAVAVHRPLVGKINTMGAGDEISVINNGITYTYEWRESFVVEPDRVDVLNPIEGRWLTLTTCHPRYNNTERLIIRAELTAVDR